MLVGDCDGLALIVDDAVTEGVCVLLGVIEALAPNVAVVEGVGDGVDVELALAEAVALLTRDDESRALAVVDVKTEDEGILDMILVAVAATLEIEIVETIAIDETIAMAETVVDEAKDCVDIGVNDSITNDVADATLEVDIDTMADADGVATVEAPRAVVTEIVGDALGVGVNDAATPEMPEIVTLRI